MELQDQIRQNLPVADPEDMEFLLEYAELLRMALENGDRDAVSVLLRYALEHSFHEAFYWAAGIMEEVCGQPEVSLAGYECDLGKHIPDFNSFITRLGVDLNAFENDIRQVFDEQGEGQSFFNIIRYRTAFDHIELGTSENFDARDNDYIQYMLVCKAG